MSEQRPIDILPTNYSWDHGGKYCKGETLSMKTARNIREHILHPSHCPEWEDIAKDPFNYIEHTGRRERYSHEYLCHTELWYAIEMYIEKTVEKGECALFDFPEGYSLLGSSSSGAVSLSNNHIRSYNDDLIIFARINYVGDAECGIVEHFRINIPRDLVDNFTKQKFNVWIRELKQKREEKQRTIEEAEWERLGIKLGKLPQPGSGETKM